MAAKTSTNIPPLRFRALRSALPGYVKWALAACWLCLIGWAICGVDLKKLNSRDPGQFYRIEDQGQSDGYLANEVERAAHSGTTIERAPFRAIAPPNATGVVSYRVKYKPGWANVLQVNWPAEFEHGIGSRIEFNGRKLELDLEKNVLQISKEVPEIRDYVIYLGYPNKTGKPLPFLLDVQFIWGRSLSLSVPALLFSAIVGIGLLVFGIGKFVLRWSLAKKSAPAWFDWAVAALALLLASIAGLSLTSLRIYPYPLIALPVIIGAICWQLAARKAELASLRRFVLPAFFVFIMLAAVHARMEFLGRENGLGLQADAQGYLARAQQLLAGLHTKGWLAWIFSGDPYNVFPREPLVIWLHMCGLSLLPQADPVMAAMVSTCLVSLLCIPVFFLLCLRYFGRLAALAAGFVYGLNPFLCDFACQGLRLELYSLGIMLLFILSDKIARLTIAGRKSGPLNWRNIILGQPETATWAALTGLVFGMHSLVRVSVLHSTLFALIIFCACRQFKIRDLAIMLLIQFVIVLPHYRVSMRGSETHDPFFSSNRAAIFYHNFEFYGAPGELTLQQISEKAVQGKERKIVDYIFKEHTLAEVFRRSLTGFAWIYLERDVQRFFYGGAIYQLQRLPDLNGLSYLEALSWFWLVLYWIGMLVIVRRQPRFALFCFAFTAPLFFLRGTNLYFFDPRLYYHQAIFWSAGAGAGLQYVAEQLHLLNARDPDPGSGV